MDPPTGRTWMGDGKKRGQYKTCAVRTSYLSCILDMTEEGGQTMIKCFTSTILLAIIAILLAEVELTS